MKKKKLHLVAVMLLVSILIISGIISLYLSSASVQTASSDRKQYCNENGCIPNEVFDELPCEPPKDMREVYLIVYYSKMRVLENFTRSLPDECYYTQPEFYETWESQGVPYYTVLSKLPRNFSYAFSYGYGAYPKEQRIEIERGGGWVQAVTFWHASWGVMKWQGMGFDVAVEPDEAIKYFEFKMEPSYMKLGPAWPKFSSDWAQKVKIYIWVEPNTPPGTYTIGINPGPVPNEIEDEWFRDLKLSYVSVAGTPVKVGDNTWQITLNIV